MDKIRKAVIFWIVVLDIIVWGQMGVYAETKNSNSNTIRECVINELEDYLAGLVYTNSDEIGVSQKFMLENSKEQSIFFVAVNGKKIGAVNVSEIDGEKVTAFLYGNFDKYIPDNEKILVKSNEDGLSIVHGDIEEHISGKDAGKTKKSESEYTNAKKIKVIDESENIEIQSDKIDGEVDKVIQTKGYNAKNVTVGSHYRTPSQISSTSNKILYYMNDVSFRQNYNINGGICWAAAGASIIDFKLNTNFTTKNVYNSLKNAYGATPIGTDDWIQRMWNLYGVPMTYVSHRVSFNTIMQKLGSRNPIMCNFFYSPDGQSLTVGHSVVLCGCYYRTDLRKYYYVYMDPNYANSGLYVVNHIPVSVLDYEEGTDFYYNDGNGLIFNNWISAFY